MENIKACPFCKTMGNTIVESTNIGRTEYFYVNCYMCDAKGPENISRSGAIANWNKAHEN